MNIETQADVERDFPAWRVWKGNDGMFHGQRREPGAGLTVKGEDWQDLADELRRAEGRLEDIRFRVDVAASDAKMLGSV